jgi:hypothetical protein
MPKAALWRTRRELYLRANGNTQALLMEGYLAYLRVLPGRTIVCASNENARSAGNGTFRAVEGAEKKNSRPAESPNAVADGARPASETSGSAVPTPGKQRDS